MCGASNKISPESGLQGLHRVAMIPFEPIAPLLPWTVSELKSLQDRTSRVVDFVEDQNSVNYPDDLQRLPDSALIAQRLKKHSITEDACRAVLWVESRGLRLLAVRTGPDASTGLVYAASKPTILNLLVSRFTQRLYKAYFDLTKKNANLDRIRAEYAESPWRLERSGTGATEVARVYYVTCDLTDYQAHLEQEPRTLASDEVAARVGSAWSILESMAPTTSPPAAMTGRPIAPEGETVRRAVDQPSWKAFEQNRAGSVSWSQVRQEFGNEMMIRIILRRRDYGPLLSMLQREADLAHPELLGYVAGCLAKIRANNDIGGDRDADFVKLEEWLAK